MKKLPFADFMRYSWLLQSDLRCMRYIWLLKRKESRNDSKRSYCLWNLCIILDSRSWSCSSCAVFVDKRMVSRMERFIAWYKNRWDCIFCGVDIPFMDYMFCIASIPVVVVISVLLFVSFPVWAIPYMIKKAGEQK